MVGQYLKNGDNQYAATRDDATRTWRILDLLNAELAIRAADLGHTPIDEQTNE